MGGNGRNRGGNGEEVGRNRAAGRNHACGEETRLIALAQQARFARLKLELALLMRRTRWVTAWMTNRAQGT
jgi:hypothetical protein